MAEQIFNHTQRGGVGMVDPTEFLSEENAKLCKAGNDLAIAAIRVVRDYDGLHRLMLEVSNWAKVVADEGRRREMYATPTKPETDES